MDIKDLITIDPDVLSGQPVFKGSRVPIETLSITWSKGFHLMIFCWIFPRLVRSRQLQHLKLQLSCLPRKTLSSFMKLLLDENLPKRLKGDFPDHQIYTVSDMGWKGVKNGALLRLMLDMGFDALLTFDKNLQYQQNFSKYTLAVFVLHAGNNTYVELTKLSGAIRRFLDSETLLKGPIVVAFPEPGP